MEIAKPGVPYACIAASTRASRPGGGSARAPVASNSPPAAMAAHRRSFVMVITLAPWIVRRLHLSFLAQREICFLPRPADFSRSEEHTSELQSLMRISYAVFCL